MRFNDNYYMDIAIEQAKKAEQIAEVPIGAVLVLEDGRYVVAHNEREISNRAIAHAEILVIDRACTLINSWRLCEATLYVTVEPCPMCAGAIVMSRIRRVVYGTEDNKAGCVHSLMNLVQDVRLNHRCEVRGGLKKDECQQLMQSFFKNLRNKN